MQLFPATELSQNLAIDLLCSLKRTKKGNRFLLLIRIQFTKVTNVEPLQSIDSYTITVTFKSHWIYHYRPRESLLFENGAQLRARFVQNFCSILGIDNVYTSTYHLLTNWQVER